MPEVSSPKVVPVEEAQPLVERVGDRLRSFKLALFSGLLTLIVTPMYAAVLGERLGLGPGAWILVTLALYAVEIAAMVALGRWARRVDGEVAPGEVRLSFIVLIAATPLLVSCAISWWREGKTLWTLGAVAVAAAIAAWFGHHLRTLRRDARAKGL